MKCFITVLALGLQAAVASAASPASSNVGTADYPQIDENLQVTFRFRATNAAKVQLHGGAGLLQKPLDLVRGSNGFWTITTPPAVPGFHYYWFVVDGVPVNDPASYSYFGYGRETGGIEVPDKEGGFYEAKRDVAHGEVRSRWYFSSITGKWRRAHVYTPPGYDAQATRRYPVLYLQHGAGENERGWIEQGRANFILDNLIASRKAQPMILVVDTGYASRPGATNNSSGRGASTSAFEEVMLRELIPTIDANYRTVANSSHRAMAGLSMGSMQTMQITLRHPETFSWIGAMSGPGRQTFDPQTAYDGAFRDAEKFNERIRLLWFGAGTAETQIYQSMQAMHQALEKSGVKSVFYTSPDTDHEWQTWRRSLHDFLPRLFATP